MVTNREARPSPRARAGANVRNVGHQATCLASYEIQVCTRTHKQTHPHGVTTSSHTHAHAQPNQARGRTVSIHGADRVGGHVPQQCVPLVALLPPHTLGGVQRIGGGRFHCLLRQLCLHRIIKGRLHWQRGRIHCASSRTSTRTRTRTTGRGPTTVGVLQGWHRRGCTHTLRDVELESCGRVGVEDGLLSSCPPRPLPWRWRRGFRQVGVDGRAEGGVVSLLAHIHTQSHTHGHTVTQHTVTHGHTRSHTQVTMVRAQTTGNSHTQGGSFVPDHECGRAACAALRRASRRLLGWTRWTAPHPPPTPSSCAPGCHPTTPALAA